jgi:hypothetical protein
MVNSSDCFLVGLLADETMDIFSVKQCTIGSKYIYGDKIREGFLEFKFLMYIMS